MASNFVLDVQDSASVDSWKNEVQALNERTEKAVREAGQALEEFRGTAEGNVFEEVCKLSSQIITSTTEVMKGMAKLCEAVTDFANLVKNVGRDLAEGVVGFVSKMF